MINGLLSKYKNISKPMKASFWFVFSNILVKGLSFITLPIFSRLLTIEQYGIISVYSSWTLLISIITTLTIWGGVFNVGMVKYSDRKAEMLSSFQGMATSLTIIVAIINIALMKYLEPIFGMSKFLIICMYIEILTQIPFNLWATKQRYEYKYKTLVAISVITSIIIPLVSVVMILNTEYKAEAKIVSNLLVQLFLGLFLFIKNQIEGKKFYSKEFWKYGFVFNIVLVPHYLSTQILNQSDRLMINKICGSGDAGVYSIAYTFAMLLMLVVSGINSSLTPHIYQSLKKGDVKDLKKQTTFVVAVVACLTLLLITFIPDVFLIMLPESYKPALKVIPPVAAGAFFQFLYPMFGSIEFYYGENRYVTIASVIGAFANVVLNYIFIRIFGFIAAAYTTLACYICFSFLHYLFMQRTVSKHSGPKDIYDSRALLLISVIVIIMSIFMSFIYDYIFVRWLIIIALLIVGIIERKNILKKISEMRFIR